MKRPTIYPHWTDEPELAAAQVTCGLLDQGLAPLILLPPERSGSMTPLFPDGHALVPEGLATRTQDNIFRAWLTGAHPVLLSELVPPACLGDGLWSSIHVLLPFLVGDWRCHASFLKVLASRPHPVRLHLFLDPCVAHEAAVRALIPPTMPWPSAPNDVPDFSDLCATFRVSKARFGEHHPVIVASNPPVDRGDLDQAVRAIEIPSPTGLQVSTERMRNQARKRNS